MAGWNVTPQKTTQQSYFYNVPQEIRELITEKKKRVIWQCTINIDDKPRYNLLTNKLRNHRDIYNKTLQTCVKGLSADYYPIWKDPIQN